MSPAEIESRRSARMVPADYIVSPVTPAVLVRLRAAVLVRHAIGKCDRCGSTLCTSPLPHQCDPGVRYGGRDYDPGMVEL